ncbi:MAG: hypothetical protein GWP91_25630 [Rhodobacterales bacterium]|nr:hypothetical protein [Rhodobacterales bacterium]
MNTHELRLARIRTALDQRLFHVRVAVESVYHRHNVSAILRTVDSIGIHHVHLVEGHFTPAKGAARGSDRWLNLHREPDPVTAIQNIQAAGFRIYIADLSQDAVPPERVPLDKPVCLWFGAELAGVGAEAKAAAEGVVTVPMRGLAQPLNVSVAAALTMRPVAERAHLLGPSAFLSDEERESVWKSWVQREDDMRNGVRKRGIIDVPHP